MAQQYKPGDWYSAASGMIMQYDGSSWKSIGQQGTPAAIEAIKGRAVNAPGAVSNTYVDEAVGEATAQASGQTSTPKISLGKIKIKAGANTASPNVLRYPLDKPIDKNSDYVSFQFYKYDPPFGRAEGGDGTPAAGQIQGRAGYVNYNTSAVGTKKSDLKSILLYMPEDIQTQFSQQWGGANFGAAAAGLMNVAGTNVSAIPAGLDALAGLAKNAIFKAELEAINKLAGADISLNQFMGGVSATIVNPNTEMMYQGPTLRTFDLTFKLVPYSDKEALEIRKIYNTFKKAMLPSFDGQAIFGAFTAGNLIKIPDVCQVTFMHGNSAHSYLPQYKLCAISDVSLNFTSDGSYATVGKNGAPVATQLKISFKEMKNIFASEIELEGPSY